ncbi:MAG: ribosome biogenesis GTPase Der [Pseudohongiellaceae bacterium]
MSPVIALVGRPNVGKSTLFNRLTRSRDALVANLPGLTRDRQYGEGNHDGKRFIVIDTGGIAGEEGVDTEVAAQSLQAVAEADICLFMVDARDGLTPVDTQIFAYLRSHNKAPILVINKIDGLDSDQACADFFQLGATRQHPLSASQGRGVNTLLQDILNESSAVQGTEQAEPEAPASIKIAIAGRPNVGKSTLINRMLGEERVVVYDEPGTTRDSVYIPFERRGKHYTLIDTAGIRRRGKTKEVVEKFSVIKSLQSIQDAHVVILLMDAQTGVAEQDLHLLGYTLEAGRALVIALNKWDGMEQEAREFVKTEIRRRLNFVDFAAIHFISAKFGSGVGELYKSVHKAFDSAHRKLNTNRLTQILEKAVTEHAPPVISKHRIKLRYAHPGGNHPPTIVIHGKQTKRLPAHYSRYLENCFRKALKLQGTPVRIELRSDDNPYTEHEQDLNQKQIARKRRIKRNRETVRKKSAKKSGKR